MHIIPDVKVGKLFPNRKLRKYVKCLHDVPSHEDFVIVRLETHARPPEEKALTVHDIPFVTRLTSVTALERAAALLSEEAAHLGWYFHIPRENSQVEGGHIDRVPTSPLTAAAYKEFDQKVMEIEDWVSSRHHFDLHNMGAKGRKMLYTHNALHPTAYALGIRVK